LAGFRNCLAEYTVHSLSPYYELLYNTIFHKNGVISHACVHGRRKEFFQGVTQGCGARKRGVGTAFPHQIIRKAALNSSNAVSISLKKFHTFTVGF